MIKSFILSMMAFLTVIMALPAIAAPSANLSEAEVKQFIGLVQKAANERDTQTLISLMSPDASIKLTIQGQTTELKRERYREVVKKGFEGVTSYQYQSTIESINLQGNRAIVHSSVKEKITYASRGTLLGDSKEICFLEKRNGKVLMTQLIGNVEVRR